MEMIQTIALGGVMAVIGAALAWMVHGLRGEVREEIRSLRRELHEEIRAVRSELGALRSDLTQVALAVGVKLRAEEA